MIIKLKSTLNPFLLKWKQMIETNTIEKVVDCYNPNAILLGTVAPTYDVGTKNIRGYFEDFFDKYDVEEVVYLSNQTQLIPNTKICVCSGVYTFRMRNEDDVTARYSFVFDMTTPNDFIINHHSSLPAS